METRLGGAPERSRHPQSQWASAELGASVQAAHPHILNHTRGHSGLTGAAEALQRTASGWRWPREGSAQASQAAWLHLVQGENGSTPPGPVAPWLPRPTLSAALGLVSVCCAPSPVAPPKPCPALPSATELPQGGSWAHHLQVPAAAMLPLPVARVCQGALAAALWCIHLVSFL